MADVPLLITAVSIWAYWAAVLVMAAQRNFARRSASVLVPRDRRERIMWLLWVPTIVAWNALPAFATKDHELLALPTWAEDNVAALAVRWIASVIAACAFIATIYCWRVMGRNWAVGVVERDQQQLVTTGPFALARHPIYALSVLLMACTVIALPTIPLAVVAAIHITLLNLKARSEEQHLLRMHGDDYSTYMRRTGRFIPKRVR